MASITSKDFFIDFRYDDGATATFQSTIPTNVRIDSITLIQPSGASYTAKGTWKLYT